MPKRIVGLIVACALALFGGASLPVPAAADTPQQIVETKTKADKKAAKKKAAKKKAAKKRAAKAKAAKAKAAQAKAARGEGSPGDSQHP